VWLAGLPSKRTSPWIWVAAVVAVLAVVAAAFFFLRGGEKVTVPDVIGETQEEAVAELEDAGLEVEVEDAAEDAEGEEGTVVAEDPGPGTEVDRGSTIRIEVIRPQQPVAVPDVIGLSQAEATAEIEALGLRAATRTETDDSVEPGSVIAQSPRPGAEVSPGSRVSLTIAKATEEPAEVEVPNVSGVSQADAEQTLADLGLEVDVVRNPSEDVAEGTVFAQLPTAGTIVAPGSTVAIVVSSGPPAEEASVSVPDVVGEELPDAQETLAKAGLKSNPVPVPGTEENADDVLGQAPVGGTMVPPGTTITLLYAQ
jgi:serine/threonine-protein kinase